MHFDYDLIVVGGGPAGATTALYAARHGLQTLLVDKSVFPRDKFCGDAIARKSLGYVRDLGLTERVRAALHEPINHATLSSPSGASIHLNLNPQPDSPSPHIVCRREIFDDILFTAAKAEVDVIEGVAVADLLTENGGVRGVRLKGGETIGARVVAGADGYNSIVARALGIYRHDSERWHVATRAYYRGLEVDPSRVEVHFTRETLPGFLWMFPTGDGVCNVGLGLTHAQLKRKKLSLRRLHEIVLASPRFRDRFSRAEREGDIHGWHLPTPDAARTIHGDGFVLVGDAAGLVDPFTGEGIGNAMCSGKVAAGVIADACHEKESRGDGLARYPELLWEALDMPELKLHARLRRLARHRSLIDLIVGRAAAHPKVMNWLGTMTREEGALVSKAQLASPLTYVKLLLKG